MKIGLIGTGRTGQFFLPPYGLHILAATDTITGYNRSNPPTVEKLQDKDVVIVFIPGEELLKSDLINMLLGLGKPVVWGSTGVPWDQWQQGLHGQLLAKNLSWIRGHNFAVGMSVMKKLIKMLGPLGRDLFPQAIWEIQETHHIHKKDQPSGTAILWKNWLQHPQEVPIHSHREGDVIGFHELSMTATEEKITIAHESLNRALFARGAYKAATLLHEQRVPAGLQQFDDVLENILQVILQTEKKS